MRECNIPDTPSLIFKWQDFTEVFFFRYLPDESSSTVVRRDHKCVTFVARSDLKICDFHKRESIDSHIR